MLRYERDSYFIFSQSRDYKSHPRVSDRKWPCFTTRVQRSPNRRVVLIYDERERVSRTLDPRPQLRPSLPFDPN